jgi:hypothetical protein
MDKKAKSAEIILGVSIIIIINCACLCYCKLFNKKKNEKKLQETVNE